MDPAAPSPAFLSTDGLDIRVQCPKPPRGGRRHDEVISRLRLSADVRKGLELERKLASDFIQCRPPGNAIPFERFLSRPAYEPILERHWNAWLGPLKQEVATALVGDLIGAQARHRVEIAVSATDINGFRTVYADFAHAGGWIDRIEEAECIGGRPFVLACHAYAEAALSHPFANGNGRLARALFQRSLARSGFLSGPSLPLGPLIYRYHRPVIQALLTVGTTADWAPFLSVMEDLCHRALNFTERLADKLQERGVSPYTPTQAGPRSL